MKYILDLECDNFLDKVTKIHCIVMKDIETNKIYTDLAECLDLYQKAELIIGHNVMAFDCKVIEKITNIKTQAELFDTLIAARLIWSHIKEYDYKNIHSGYPQKLVGRQSLEAWGYRLKLNKGKPPEQWDEFTEEMLEYCILDVEVTHVLYKKILEKNYSLESLNLEHKVQAACVDMMTNGIEFNTKKARELYSELSDERSKLEKQLSEYFPSWEETEEFIPKVNNKSRGYVKGQLFIKRKTVDFNPNSRDHIAMRLKAQRGWQPTEFTPDGRPKVDDSVLAGLEWSEAKFLARMFMIQKRLGQLAEGNNAWLKLENKGRIYSTINTNGAVTGRATHATPNLAQVVSVNAEYGDKCRELFTAKEGCLLVGADMSQLELRMLGHYMHPFDDGDYAKEVIDGDVHTRTLQALELKPNQRPLAKKFIYTFLYGGGAKRIGETMGKTPSEGKRLREMFLKKIPALKMLIDGVQNAAESTGDLKGLDGRRIFVRSTHAALNCLLQSAGAIVSKYWIDNLTSYLNDDIKLVGWIHDEVILEVSEDKAEQAKIMVIQAIEDITDRIGLRVQLTGDSRIGRNWKEIH
jgi:DNA polymerase I-like protein with 3'-5' exonuclease and polymerase domains